MLGGISGIAFLILSIVTAIIVPPPTATSDPAKIIAYFGDHRGALLLSGYLNAVTIIPAALFAIALYRLLRSIEGPAGILAMVSVLGMAVTGAVVIAGSAVSSAVAYTGRDLDAAVARPLNNLVLMAQVFPWLPMALWAGSAGVVLLRAAGAMRWLGYLGLLMGVLALIAAASVARSGIFALGGVLVFVAVGVSCVWILAMSIAMLRQGRATVTTARIATA